jgi:hypothetical protein
MRYPTHRGLVTSGQGERYRKLYILLRVGWNGPPSDYLVDGVGAPEALAPLARACFLGAAVGGSAGVAVAEAGAAAAGAAVCAPALGVMAPKASAGLSGSAIGAVVSGGGGAATCPDVAVCGVVAAGGAGGLGSPTCASAALSGVANPKAARAANPEVFKMLIELSAFSQDDRARLRAFPDKIKDMTVSFLTV